MFDQILIDKFFRPQDHAKMDPGLTKSMVTDKRLKILDADGRFLKHFLATSTVTRSTCSRSD